MPFSFSLARICWFVALWLGMLSTQATVLPVTNLQDAGPGSLRETVATAVNGDTLDLRALSGTILLDSQIVLDRNLTLLGPGADLLAISGQQQCRHFLIPEPSDTIRIEDLTLYQGSAIAYPENFFAAGSINNYGHLTLVRCHLTANRGAYGGAVNVGRPSGNATLMLSQCTFSDNVADRSNWPDNGLEQNGGAIYATGSQQGRAIIQATNCTFSNNRADDRGGAVSVVGDIAGGTDFRPRNCTFARNKARIGGGIDNFIFAAVVLRNCIVAENEGINTPDISGYVISQGYNLIGDPGTSQYVADSTDLVGLPALITDLGYFASPLPTHALACGSPAVDAAGPGAPLLDQRGLARAGAADLGAHEARPELDTRLLNLNDTGAGSLRQGIFLACPGDTLDLGDFTGVIALTRPIVLDKSLTLIGNPDGPLVLEGGDSTRLFDILPGQEVAMSWLTLRHGGPALYGGGAIRNKGHLSISHSTLSHNSAVSGGAIGNYGDGGRASLSLTNCTFYANEATVLDGGAIDNRAITDPAFLAVLHCTFAWNEAAYQGGAIANSPADTAALRHVLMAYNLAAEGPDGRGSFVANGPNLISQSQGMTLSGTGHLLDTDPLLEPLGNYGGPTFTCRLPAGSPAVDAGSGGALPLLDQRGESRLFNGLPDLGAYEYDPSTRLASQTLTPRPAYPNPSRGELWLPWATQGQPAEVAVYSL
ncbi:MAG: hypothetical protein D6722_12200, partial [Bacteroidetes bacterium]